jgi:hypothetical protein
VLVPVPPPLLVPLRLAVPDSPPLAVPVRGDDTDGAVTGRVVPTLERWEVPLEPLVLDEATFGDAVGAGTTAGAGTRGTTGDREVPPGGAAGAALEVTRTGGVAGLVWACAGLVRVCAAAGCGLKAGAAGGGVRCATVSGVCGVLAAGETGTRVVPPEPAAAKAAANEAVHRKSMIATARHRRSRHSESLDRSGRYARVNEAGLIAVPLAQPDSTANPSRSVALTLQA